MYPGHHNIIADQFADEVERNEMNARYFDKTNEPTTGHLKWWADNKPIWASARYGIKLVVNDKKFWSQTIQIQI